MKRVHVPELEDLPWFPSVLRTCMTNLIVVFARKFGVDVLERFRAPLEEHRAAGWLTFGNGRIEATRPGLLRIDTLLPSFFRAEHRNARYA